MGDKEVTYAVRAAYGVTADSCTLVHQRDAMENTLKNIFLCSNNMKCMECKVGKEGALLLRINILSLRSGPPGLTLHSIELFLSTSNGVFPRPLAPKEGLFLL